MLSIPKLFIGGKQDAYVPPGEVQEVFEAAGNPKQLAMLDSVHVYRRRQLAAQAVNEMLEAFLDTAESLGQ